MDTKRVFVWSSFRSISNAFERSLRNLEDAKVFHEPFERCFYLSEDRRSDLFVNREPVAKYNFKAVSAELQQDYHGVKYVLAKNSASYVRYDHHILLDDGFKTGFRHTFLIRNPAKSMRSILRLYERFAKSTVGNHWQDRFDPGPDGGDSFLPLFSLYTFVREHIDPNPVIVDADELLEDPEAMMQAYCKALELRYKHGMTKWEPGSVKDWEAFPELCEVWHDEVIKTSGFYKHETKPLAPLSDELEDIVKKCMPYYESMYKKRLTVFL